MDVVIPYLENKSGELEACISLIKKNLPHRSIHVVTRYEEARFSQRSHVNQILKLKWAIENLAITDEFYLFNDDIFVLNPVEDIPYYNNGTLADRYTKTHWLPQKRAMKNTLDLFPKGLSYELHVPMKFNKKKLYNIIRELEAYIQKGKCPLIRSFYGNTYSVGGEYMEDVKNIKNYKGKTFLSTDDNSFERKIGEYVRSRV